MLMDTGRCGLHNTDEGASTETPCKMSWSLMLPCHILLFMESQVFRLEIIPPTVEPVCEDVRDAAKAHNMYQSAGKWSKWWILWVLQKVVNKCTVDV